MSFLDSSPNALNLAAVLIADLISADMNSQDIQMLSNFLMVLSDALATIADGTPAEPEEYNIKITKL